MEIDDNDIKTFPKLQREWSRAVSVAAVKRLAPVEMALGDADFKGPIELIVDLIKNHEILNVCTNFKF